jgi:hypothetical protein
VFIESGLDVNELFPFSRHYRKGPDRTMLCSMYCNR